MRKGGMTFDEREVFAVEKDCDPSTSYDESKFFHNFYRVDSGSEFDDRSTIGHMVTRSASRFHYNAVENGIIRAIAHREPIPYGTAVRAWEFAQSRGNWRLLDIGTGTGHWIDFFMDALYVSEALGLEVAPNIGDFLREKYAGRPDVKILDVDIGAESFSDSAVDGRFDYISAIGVMFHITDDEKWMRAIRNLQSVLAPGGLMFVGGDFGSETQDIQFHRTDEFDDWNAQRDSNASRDVLVNKRVRSLARWHRAATESNLAVVDLVRVDSDWSIHTPENDLLVLGHATPTP